MIRADRVSRSPAVDKPGSSAMRPILLSVPTLSTNTQATTPLTSVNFNSALPNSTAALMPNMRLMPFIGLSLENLGATEPSSNRKPPVAPEEAMATAAVKSNRGAISKKLSSNSWAKIAGSKFDECTSLRSKLNPEENASASFEISILPVIRIIASAAMVTAAAGNSCERAT